MASNLYKVGDWVYCEVSPYQPYVIRRIEELTKTPCGNVEAKVICAFRRRDISSTLLSSIEKYQNEYADASDMTPNGTSVNSNGNGGAGAGGEPPAELTDLQKHQLKHRELFYSKHTETIAVTTIRAKCSVLLFCPEVEKYSDYLSHDDLFYYHLTYDPYQRTVVADRGEIRVGLKYQVEIPLYMSSTHNQQLFEEDRKRLETVEYEKLKWQPNIQNNKNLTEREIDQFLTIAKSVGTFARALDCNNSFKQPSLPLSAASASRDITLFHAMNALHEHDYNIGKAALSLVTSVGPIICKDEMEDWSAAEANLFEDALDKYGKDFNEIRKDFLPWKTLRSIIEYYYMWKTTDRYVQQKRVKSTEQESKLKQVYIPNHTKQNQSALLKTSQMQTLGQHDIQMKSCESCGIQQSQQWYLYNPTPNVLALINPTQNTQHQAQQQLQASNVQPRLCGECWIYWKKHAAFKYQNARTDRINQLKAQTQKCIVVGCNKEFKSKQLLAKHCASVHGCFLRAGSPKPQLRNRSSFYLLTTPQTQASRFVCKCLMKNLRKFARKPSRQIDFGEVAREWEKETRNIKQIIETNKRNFVKRLKQKLNKPMIKNIYKKSKIRANNKPTATNKKENEQSTDEKTTTNHENGIDKDGEQEKHNGVAEAMDTNDTTAAAAVADEDVEYENLFVKKPPNAPEYFAYFEQKPTTPAYTAEKMLYPKPTPDFIQKFHLNLVSQAKKRTHEQTGNDLNQSQQTDTSPSSKRSLIVKQQTTPTNTNKQSQSQPTSTRKDYHQSKTIIKPTQFLTSNNNSTHIGADNSYYKLTKRLKQVREEVDIQQLRKLARSPFRTLKQYQNQYSIVSKIHQSSIAALNKRSKTTAATSGGGELDLSVKSSSSASASTALVPPPPTTPIPSTNNTDNETTNTEQTKLNGNGEVVVLD